MGIQRSHEQIACDGVRCAWHSESMTDDLQYVATNSVDGIVRSSTGNVVTHAAFQNIRVRRTPLNAAPGVFERVRSGVEGVVVPKFRYER